MVFIYADHFIGSHRSVIVRKAPGDNVGCDACDAGDAGDAVWGQAAFRALAQHRLILPLGGCGSNGMHQSKVCCTHM